MTAQTAGNTATDHQTTDDIRETFDAYARWIDRLAPLDRLMIGRYRRRQFQRARGPVLDVACGTGTNFQYLPESVELVGIDLSEEMLGRAAAELDRIDRTGTLHQMDAEALSFEDDSFDTVISALSTCTFPDPDAALREMSRVCAPNGRILLLEHGRSDFGPLARYQEWRANAHYRKSGCRLIHEPLEVARNAGLSIVETDHAQLGRLTTIVASPELEGRS